MKSSTVLCYYINELTYVLSYCANQSEPEHRITYALIFAMPMACLISHGSDEIDRRKLICDSLYE